MSASAASNRTLAHASATAATPVTLAAPSIRCGGCVAAIEALLARRPDVEAARANLSLRRISVTPARGGADLAAILSELERIGHRATVIDEADLSGEATDETAAALLRAAAVAGFGAMNVMLLSVAVWSGAGGATRDALHALSALIAIPVIAYSGRFFFASAWSALRCGRTNMDVPISLGILLALGLSLHETALGGEEAFFDAALTLAFFLLAGRYLDHRMRDRARSAMTGLSRLAVKEALEATPDGTRPVPAEAIRAGMRLRIPAGERFPADARIVAGATDLDRSLVTGELSPIAAAEGDEVEAGALNLTGPVDAVALRPVGESFLAAMMRMLAAAEAGRGRYVRIADRAARLYAPVVHILALATLAGWLAATGDWRVSAFVAISVLIVTCPCALALAVPVAHVVAAGRLMAEGVLMKDGAALERMDEIDRVVWDKTGTLTTGAPALASHPSIDGETAAAVAALASRSAHPAARAIAEGLPARAPEADAVVERPGCGVEGVVGGRRARLGRPGWVAEIAGSGTEGEGPAFAFEGGATHRFPLEETLRPGAAEAIVALRREGLPSEILSGDGAAAVARAAGRLDVAEARHGLAPADKIARLDALRAEGARPLMVGDGLNDAAALAAAHVSMAPASASEVGRAAADFVFLREGLGAVPFTRRTARQTARIVRQNFALAILYNCVAVPLAVAGLVTPLVAAIAMSTSSIAVVANSLRLRRDRAPRAATEPAAAPPGAFAEAPA